MAYDVEPPMSTQQRTMSIPVVTYLDSFDEEKKTILRLLLDCYAETKFSNGSLFGIYVKYRFVC